MTGVMTAAVRYGRTSAKQRYGHHRSRVIVSVPVTLPGGQERVAQVIEECKHPSGHRSPDAVAACGLTLARSMGFDDVDVELNR